PERSRVARPGSVRRLPRRHAVRRRALGGTHPGTGRRAVEDKGRKPAGFLPRLLVFPALSANRGHAGAILAGSLASLAAGRSRFLGGELVRGSLFVRRLAALASRLPGFLRAELVRRALQVRGLPTLAGDFPLFCFIHGTEASLAACRHFSPPLKLDVARGACTEDGRARDFANCYRRYQFS